MKKVSLVLICTLCLFLLSGCWDKRELEDNTFVVLLGLDESEDKNVILTAAFPLTQTEGGGANEGVDNGSGEYTVMSVKAPTVVEALNMFSTKLSGPIAIYTVKTIIISRALAESDILRHVFSSWRYEEVRNTTNILISECRAAEFIQARVKASPIDPLRQEELLLEQANTSAYYKPVQLLEFLTNLKSDGADVVAMYGGIAFKSEDKNSSAPEDGKETSGIDTGIKETVKDGYLPGEIPIQAENTSEISGLAVFHKAKMVGVLNSSEAQTYSMFTQGKLKKILTLPDPLKPDSDIVVSIMPASKCEIRSAIKNNIPVFDISINLVCSVESIQSEIDYTSPEKYNILTEYVKGMCTEDIVSLIRKIQKEYNADILKLGDKLAYNFRTVKEWEDYNWSEKYKDAEINLTVELDIEGTGIMMP